MKKKNKIKFKTVLKEGNAMKTLTEENAGKITEQSMVDMMYNQYSRVLGGGSQLFTMEYPGRVLNQLDYAYKIENYTDSALGKPYIVAENEFKLSDDMMDIAPIVNAPNGNKVSSAYDSALNNLTPKIDDIKDYIIDKMELRSFLLQPITDFIEDKEYTCSRMEFCQKLYLHYLDEKAKWDQEKYDKNKEHTTNDTLDDYAQWLATTAWTKDKALEQLFNDAIVRGFYHEIMTILGFLDIASPAERLQNAKLNKRTSIRRTIDASGMALPVTLQPTNWFRSLSSNFSPKDLTLDMEQLIQDYQAKVNLLSSLKAELRVLVSNSSTNDDISKLQDIVNSAKNTLDDAEKECFKSFTKAQQNMIELVFEVLSKGDMESFLLSDTAENELRNFVSDDFAKTIGISTNSLTDIFNNTLEMYKNHIDYFCSYQQLLQAQINLAASKTSNYSDKISVLSERIALLEREVAELSVIVVSGSNNSNSSTDDKSNSESGTDILPISRYDEDSSYSDIVFTNKEVSDFLSKESSSTTANVTVGVGRWFFQNKTTFDYSVANSKVIQSMFSNDFTVGMRVTKVNIERGGWFDPGIFDMSASYMRLKKNIRSGVGLTAQEVLNIYSDTNNSSPVNNINRILENNGEKAIFPAFPVAFLVAKDIVIKATVTGVTDIEQQEFKSMIVNSSSSLFGIRLSGGYSSQAYCGFSSNSDSSTTLTIKVPGPQIVGWYLQMTPEDKSADYVSLSKSEYFNEIIDSLKAYMDKMNSLNNNNNSVVL